MRMLKRAVGIALAVACLPGGAGVLADDAAEVQKLRAEIGMLRARIRDLERQLAAAKGLSAPASTPAEKELASPEALMATAPAEPDCSGMTGGQKKAVMKAHARAMAAWLKKYRGKTVVWTLIVDDVRPATGPSESSGAKGVCLAAHSKAGTAIEATFPPSHAPRLRTIRKRQHVRVTCRVCTCPTARAKGAPWCLEGVACGGAGEPASRPTATKPALKVTDTPPDPAAGPEALLAKAPPEPDCKGMTTAQAQAARAAHAEAVAKWQNACRGKTVRWTVTVDDVSTEKRRSYRSGSGGVVAVHVRGRSPGGSKVYLTFPPQHAARLMKMQNHEIIRITGKIVCYTRSGPRVGWSLQGTGFQEVKEPATQPAETPSG